MNRVSTLLLLLSLVTSSGCSTYLGYDIYSRTGPDEIEVVATQVRDGVAAKVMAEPSPTDPVLAVKVYTSTEQTRRVTPTTRETKTRYMAPWNPGRKLAEILVAPIAWVFGVPVALEAEEKDAHLVNAFPPFDLLSRLFGGSGIHKRLYAGCGASKRPPYLVRLSQNTLVGYLNPFQCMQVVGKSPPRCIKDDATRTIRHEHRREHRIVDEGVANVEVTASTDKSGCSPLTARTDGDGVARINLSPWRTSLPAHSYASVTFSATTGQGAARSTVVVLTDKILSRSAVAKWDADELEKRRKTARKALEAYAPRQKALVTALEKLGVKQLCPREYSNALAPWETLQQEIAGKRPPSAAGTESLAKKALAGLEALHRDIPRRYELLLKEVRELQQSTTKAMDVAAKGKAAIHAPVELRDAQASFTKGVDLLKPDRPTAAALRAAQQSLLAALTLVQDADKKTTAALGGAMVSAAPARAHPKAHSRALVIGIDRYHNFPALRNAVSDAKAIAAILATDYGFGDVKTLYNSDATAENILKSFKTLIKGLVEGDNVFVFYAGHGKVDETLGRGYWIPVDAKKETDFVSNSDIVDFVKAMDRKDAGHVLVVADSCFSGSLVEDMSRDARGLGIRPKSETAASDWIQRLDKKRSRYVLASGAYDETVPDTGGRGGHSVFTDCLLEELRNPAHNVFTAKELAVRVRRLVSANSKQSPTDGILRNTGHKGGEFIFCHSPEKKH